MNRVGLGFWHVEFDRPTAPESRYRGEFKLSDPVKKSLPEFSGDRREEVTVQHLLEAREAPPLFHSLSVYGWKSIDICERILNL